MQPLLLLTCLYAVLASSAQAQTQADPSRTVKDVNEDCPVNNTLYTEDEFSMDKLFKLMTPMVSQGSQDSPCARAVPNLADCATDGSLQVREGCCSAGCAGKMQEALVKSGKQCYREFIEVMCNSTEIRNEISGVLFGAAKRCLGLQPSCELLSQPGDLLNATTAATNSSNSTAATPQPQQEQPNAGNSTQKAAPNNSTGSVSRTGSGSSSSSANVGNSAGMNELAAALAAQAAAPYTAPDPFMPLVPRPVETAASAVVLATPEEIETAARNGSKRAIVTSAVTSPVTSNVTRQMNSSNAAGTAGRYESRTPPGAQGLAPPAAAATAVDEDKAVPAAPAAPAAAPTAKSSSSTLFVDSWAAVMSAVMLLLTVALCG